MAMERLAPLLAAFALLAAPAAAQEDQNPDEETDAAETAAEADESASSEDVDLLDDPELDIQGFDPDADDDFIPSEEIPADEPIAFPTDI